MEFPFTSYWRKSEESKRRSQSRGPHWKISSHLQFLWQWKHFGFPFTFCTGDIGQQNQLWKSVPAVGTQRVIQPDRSKFVLYIFFKITSSDFPLFPLAQTKNVQMKHWTDCMFLIAGVTSMFWNPPHQWTCSPNYVLECRPSSLWLLEPLHYCITNTAHVSITLKKKSKGCFLTL